jgi:nicotinate-nucleotide adenylyltransferase
MVEPRRIAIFGGTFDPVHLGHLHIAGQAREALDLDEVRFLPCPISPHKDTAPHASAADRLEMLRLATAGLPWARVDDHELGSGAPAFSYLTAEALRASQPDTRWFWLLGGDQWDALPGWRHPERLAAAVEFIVFERGGRPVPVRPGYRLHVVRGDHPASATVLRDELRQARRDHPWLPPPVAAWIADHGLYRS